MKYKLRRIGVLSLASLLAVVNTIVALLFGWPLIFLDFLGGSGVGTGTYILMIIMGAFFGFIGGALIAIVYNVLFALIGGLMLELEEVT